MLTLLLFLFAQFTVPAHTGAVAVAPTVTCSGPPYTDNFTGSGSLSSCWTQTTASGFVPLVRSSGYAVPNAASSQGIAVYTGATFGSTQSIQCVLVWTAGNYSGCGIYTDTAGDGAYYIPNLNAVYKLVAGSGTGAYISGCSAFTSGDTVKVEGTPSATTVTDVTTSTVLCTGSAIPGNTGLPGIYVDTRAAAGDKITSVVMQ